MQHFFSIFFLHNSLQAKMVCTSAVFNAEINVISLRVKVPSVVKCDNVSLKSITDSGLLTLVCFTNLEDRV